MEGGGEVGYRNALWERRKMGERDVKGDIDEE